MRTKEHLVVRPHLRHALVFCLCCLTVESIPAAQTPSCTQPPSGLVGWWPGDGNYKDIIGHNDGTPVGGVTFSPGEVAQAFSLNGSSVQAPNSSAVDITGDLTIEAWIKPASSTRGYVVLKGDGNDFFNAYSLRYGGGDDQRLLLSVADGSTGTRASYFESGPVVPIGVFSHVAVTIQGTTAALYVNGVTVGGQYFGGVLGQPTQPATQLTANRFSDHGVFRIGNGSSPNLIPFIGLIDELSVYNRAISASEIQAIFNAGAGGKCKGCQVNVTRLGQCTGKPGHWGGEIYGYPQLSNNLSMCALGCATTSLSASFHSILKLFRNCR